MGVGEVFIFILAALTFILILIFGYKAIAGFVSSGEEVALVQFKTDLENAVKKIYTEYGAVRVETFHAPLDYQHICFVDLDAAEMSGLEQKDPLAYDAWTTAQQDFQARPELRSAYAAAEQNVFLTPRSEGLSEVQIKVYKISINNQGQNYLCLPLASGSFRLVLEGKGDHTELSAAEE